MKLLDIRESGLTRSGRVSTERRIKFIRSEFNLTRSDIAGAIITAFSLAVTAPLFDILGDNVEFFIARQAEPSDYFTFAVGLSVLLPTLVVGLVLLGRPHAVRIGLTLAVFACLVSVLVLQIIKPTPLTDVLPGSVQIGLGIAAGLGASVALARWRTMRTFLRIGLIMPFLLTAFFLWSGPVRAAMDTASAGETFEIAEPAPVVFLIFDELPVTTFMRTDGSLNEKRFPNFARLARHTTWFVNAFANSPSTTVSVPSILSGRYPDDDDVSSVPVTSRHPENLFTLLGDQYSVVGGESVTMLCPDEICQDAAPRTTRWRSLPTDTWYVLLHLTLPESMRFGLPPIDEAWTDFANDRTTQHVDVDSAVSSEESDPVRQALLGDRRQSFRQFVEGITRADRRVLYFHHALVPHRPWQYLPSGQSYEANPRVPGTDQGTWTDQEFLVDQGYQRHMLQAGLADTMVGQLLDRLEQQELLEDSLIFLTADHGMAFQPGEPMRGSLVEDRIGSVGAVPLFASIGEKWDGVRVDAPVELVDILPTIASSLEADADWEFDGVSLHATLSGDSDANREILTFPGPVSHDDAPAARKQATEELAARYELDAGWDRLLNPSLSFGLVGQAPDALAVGTPLDWTVELVRLGDLESVDLQSDTLPIAIEGWIADGGEDGSEFHLALALNGKISTVAKTFDQARGDMVSALIRRGDLRDGMNRLDLFLVEESGSGVLLRPIPDVRSVD